MNVSSHIKAYAEMVTLAHKNKQVVGEKSDYYVTLQQAERILAQTAQPDKPKPWRDLGPEQAKIAPQCAQTTRAFVK